MVKKFDGSRVREVMASHGRAMLDSYTQFESLIPAVGHAGSAHHGEDGRFVESLVRGFLKPILPAALEVATGFVLRPAVKTGEGGNERRGRADQQSSQLDVIVYDAAAYPVFHRFEDSVVIPPEAAVALISVKKHLRPRDVTDECEALFDAGRLCRSLDVGGNPRRGPFLALLGMAMRDFPEDRSKKLFESISAAYEGDPKPRFDETIGFVGALTGESAFKKRPNGDTPSEAKYLGFSHSEGDEHWGLQLLLTGILSVYYDGTRSQIRRPGFTGFESGRKHDRYLGRVSVGGMR